MPYRHNIDVSDLCLICSSQTSVSCRNCGGSHCDQHLVAGRCAGCEGTLWQIERRIAKSVTLGYSAVALLLATAAVAAGLATGFASGLLVVAPALLIASMFAMSRGVPLVVRLAVKGKLLMPSSVKLLPTAFDVESVDNPPRPRRRPRNGMGTRRPRPPRAVFMTRGGYFYQ